MTRERARAVHLVVAAVAWFALVLQLILVLQGGRVLDEVDPPGLVARIYRYFAYFTIQSNILVAGEEGWGAVGIACAGITILFPLLFALYAWLDRRLRPAPR